MVSLLLPSFLYSEPGPTCLEGTDKRHQPNGGVPDHVDDIQAALVLWSHTGDSAVFCGYLKWPCHSVRGVKFLSEP